MMPAEVFPFFHRFTVRQMADAVFGAVFIFTDFGLAALFYAKFRSGIGYSRRRGGVVAGG